MRALQAARTTASKAPNRAVYAYARDANVLRWASPPPARIATDCEIVPPFSKRSTRKRSPASAPLRSEVEPQTEHSYFLTDRVRRNDKRDGLEQHWSRSAGRGRHFWHTSNSFSSPGMGLRLPPLLRLRKIHFEAEDIINITKITQFSSLAIINVN